ncbi:MAG: KAP family NTPase [Clostridia bacterium]|nr:KAP family NTPase [Clostridia bacterium]
MAYVLGDFICRKKIVDTKPTSYDESDLFTGNRRKIIFDICTAIENLQGNKQGDTGYEDINSIAVDGEWGSGKSFIKKKLIEKLKTEHPQSYIIVDYNAGENAFYNDPLIALLYCIYDDFIKFYKAYKKKSERFYNRKLRKCIRKVRRYVERCRFKDAAIKLRKKLGPATPGFSVLDFMVESILIFIESAKGLLNNERLQDYESYTELINQIVITLNIFTEYKAGDSNENFKIIIFVDELDRCRPDMQMAVLERLYNLRKIKNCMIIGLVNEAQIARTYNTMYGCSEDGYEGKIYLKKFFKKHIRLLMHSNLYFQFQLDNLILLHSEYKFNKSEIALIQAIIFNMVTRDVTPLQASDSAQSKTGDNGGGKKVTGDSKQDAQVHKTDNQDDNYSAGDGRGNASKAESSSSQNGMVKANVILDNREITRMMDNFDNILGKFAFHEYADAYFIILLYVSFSKVYNNKLFGELFSRKYKNQFFDLVGDTKTNYAALQHSGKVSGINYNGDIQIYKHYRWPKIELANLLINIWISDPANAETIIQAFLTKKVVRTQDSYGVSTEYEDTFGIKGKDKSVRYQINNIFLKVNRFILGDED